MQKLLFFCLLLTGTVVSFGQTKKEDGTQHLHAPVQNQQPIKVTIGDVELHYIERGKGEPLIPLHGGQGALRAWPRQMEVLTAKYQVISYSRRSHSPNANPLTATTHSTLVDATDLAGFIAFLKPGPVHLVGTSYGAFTAPAFDYSGLVKTMALAEPPLLQWDKDTPRGAALYNEFMTAVHLPAGKGFAAGDSTSAMRIFINRFDGPGAFDSLPADRRRTVMQNARFFRAATATSDPFPELEKEKVSKLAMPVLIICVADTKEPDMRVSEELVRTLPNAEKAIIPQTGHGSPRQNTGGFNAALLAFLAKHGRKGSMNAHVRCTSELIFRQAKYRRW